MRTLPESPSVEHLRRQAKDLLVSLRTTDQSARLNDAQALLARQHGYASWAELKAEAEAQRAAPPVLADETTVGALLSRFGLEAAGGSMVLTGSDWAGRTWEVDTTSGRVEFTELERYVTADAIEAQVGLVDAAIAAGIRTPVPLRTTGEHAVAEIDSVSWRAHRWCRLGPRPGKPTSPPVAAAAGRILATLHGLETPPPGPVVPWLTRRPSRESWTALIEQCRQERPEWSDALSRTADAVLALCAAVADDRDPNERAIFSHSWLAPDAVRVAGSDSLVVCSWEHAGATPKDWELGSCLHSWAEVADGRLAVEPAQAFLDAYREASTTPVPPLELRMLTTAVSQVANWTASRVNIALNGSDAVHRADAARNVEVLLDRPLTVETVQSWFEQLD